MATFSNSMIFNYIAQVARLNITTLATLALSPGVPQQVRVSTTNLDNDTILKWESPKNFSGELSYQIVWRETAVNNWQYAADAKSFPGQVPNSVRLPVSKDNVFFGVRACTSKGICSQAVAPVLSREK